MQNQNNLNPFASFAVALLLLPIPKVVAPAYAEDQPPVEWIEPRTGHRVVRLSREPGSASLYFHQYPFSADGKKMVFTTRQGISTVNLETREVEPVVRGRVRVLVTGRKTGDVYYVRDDAVWAAKLDTHDERRVAELPHGLRSGNVAVNADETLIVGVAVDPDGEAKPRTMDMEIAGHEFFSNDGKTDRKSVV